MSLSFEGGPVGGDELHGFTARMIENVDPPFVCFSIDGRWEHYVRAGDGKYTYAKPCHEIALGPGHPACGHDHEQGW